MKTQLKEMDTSEKTQLILKLIKKTDDDGLLEIAHYILGDLGNYGDIDNETADLDKVYDELVDQIQKASSKTIDRLYQILKRQRLVETDGFENKKGVKETNVGEDLRNNYETGKLVPYQSVIAEGKIVVKRKLKENKSSGMSEEYFKNQFTEYLENTIDYFEFHENGNVENDESAKELLRKIVWDFITESQTEIYEDFRDKLKNEST
jgi:hypothetical protein